MERRIRSVCSSIPSMRALDEANEGFVAALEESGLDCEIDQQNASGDSSATLTIGQKMVDDKKDLIFTIATPAAQAVADLLRRFRWF